MSSASAHPPAAGGRPAPEPADLVAMMPLADTLGLRVDSAGPDEVVGRMAWSAPLCTVGGVLHGGILVALADSVAGMCAYLNLPPGATTSTIELKSNFFAPVRGGEVVAVARPLHRGRTVIVVQTDLTAPDSAGRPRRVAQVTQSQAVLS